MTFDINAAIHTCNVIRRDTESEYPHLQVVFIVHRKGECKKILENKIDEFHPHYGGKHFVPHFRKYKEIEHSTGYFLGLAKAKKPSLLSVFSPEQYLAVFIINYNFFNDADHIRQHALSCVFHALFMISEDKSGRTENINVKGKIITPRLKPTEQAMNNMLADAFSAIVMEKTGITASIKKLAKRRSILTLSPELGYKAEEYPYPISLDATQIIYDEYVPIPNLRGKPMHQAFDMTMEIRDTFDESNIRQWWVFSRSAQEMAWMNIDPHKILSAAIYTSEDPYVRSTGYIIADAVNIDPTPLTDINFYNAFTDQEINERNHFRICEENFQILITRVLETNSSTPFKKAAIDQNKALLEGKLLGWSSYALLKASDSYEEAENTNIALEQSKDSFDNACKSIPWDSLIEFNDLIIRRRIRGIKITMEALLKIAGKNEVFNKLYEAFDITIKDQHSASPLSSYDTTSHTDKSSLEEYLQEDSKKKLNIELTEKETNLSLEDDN